MASVFHEWGRTLGRLSVPALQKAKLAWHALAGSAEDRWRAERALGAVMAQRIRSASSGTPTASDVHLVRSLGAALATRLKNRQIKFHFDVLSVPEPSAMALPGGYIFISDSLLALCRRYPDEIAFVLGHEMAHVIRGHATDRFLEESILQALMNRLRSSTPLGGLVKETAFQLLTSSYSQDCEYEADELGSRLAQATGHHPLASLRLLDRLKGLTGNASSIGQYFSSHPTPSDRMARLARIWRAKS